VRRYSVLLLVVALAAVGCFRKVAPPNFGPGSGGQQQQQPVELEVIQKPNGQTYDLIPLIDPKLDRQHGDRWAVLASGELRCDDQHAVPRIHVPYKPPEEYDFTVVFSQPNLRNGISLIMPKPGGGQFFWAIGYGGGTEYGFGGVQRTAGRIDGLIKTNTKYETTVQVRRGGVVGCINGRILASHQTNYNDLRNAHEDWRDMKDKTVLAVACDDPTTFHVIRITEVTGQGTRIR